VHLLARSSKKNTPGVKTSLGPCWRTLEARPLTCRGYSTWNRKVNNRQAKLRRAPVQPAQRRRTRRALTDAHTGQRAALDSHARWHHFFWHSRDASVQRSYAHCSTPGRGLPSDASCSSQPRPTQRRQPSSRERNFLACCASGQWPAGGSAPAVMHSGERCCCYCRHRHCAGGAPPAAAASPAACSYCGWWYRWSGVGGGAAEEGRRCQGVRA
jgi:hypothetical protein